MIASKQIAFGKAEGKGLSAKSYIQDGLVAMWDGIENAGWGVHDADLLIQDWKPLVGKSDMIRSLVAPDLQSAYKILDNAVIYDVKSNTYVGLQYTMSNMMAASPFTLDVCALGSICSLGGFPNDLSFWGYGENTYRLLLDNNTWSYFGGAGHYSIVLGEPCTSTVVCSVSNVRGYKNTNPASENFKESPIQGGTVPLQLNILGCKRTNTLIGSKLHSFRIYNRALTAEEIAHNYEIDKARFGL